MFGYRRELRKYEEMDEDELLASLSVEEIQELEQELEDLDPDTNIPIGLRQKDQTVKTPGGAFNREALLKYWEEENKKLIREEREEAKPLQELQDKSYVQGELETINTNNSTLKDKEKKRLIQKTRNIPAQNSSAKDDNKVTNKNIKTNVSATSKSDMKMHELDKPKGNPIIIDEALEQILANDSALIEVNLNNKEDISQEMLLRFTEALGTNVHVQIFSLANTHADDRVAFAIAKMLQENSSIRSLNIESNFVSGQGILTIMDALQKNRTLIELRFHNQRHICGVKVEMEMVQMLRENTSLIKLGYQFELAGPRMAATSILTRNQDQHRQKRLQEKKKQCEQEVGKQVTNPSAENVKNIRPAPPPNQEVPTRKIAEMVKQKEAFNKTQPRKLKTKKCKNDTNENEGVDILKDMRNSLKSSVNGRDEVAKLPPPQRSGRDDLMAAIRGSSIFSLKRVDSSQT